MPDKGVDQRTVYLRCEECAHAQLYRVEGFPPQLFLESRFRPKKCLQCGQHAAVPAPRPYEITESDRRILKQLRVAADA
jgi:hypothetical protein